MIKVRVELQTASRH